MGDGRWGLAGTVSGVCLLFSSLELEDYEQGQDETEADHAAPDFGVAPSVFVAAPLEGQKEADNGGD